MHPHAGIQIAKKKKKNVIGENGAEVPPTVSYYECPLSCRGTPDITTESICRDVSRVAVIIGPQAAKERPEKMNYPCTQKHAHNIFFHPTGYLA